MSIYMYKTKNNLNKRWIFKNLCGSVVLAIEQKKEV